MTTELHFRRLLHALDATKPRWVVDAACRGMDPALFFPERGDPAHAARAVCADCVVRAECAEYGMAERDGIWGGLNGNERRAIKRTKRRAKKGEAA